MFHHRIVGVALLTVYLLITGCVTGAVGGKPQLPLSDQHGSERVFNVSLAGALSAIRSTFGNYAYRGMVLRSGSEQATNPGRKAGSVFTLWSMHEPIAKVPLDQAQTKWVPYIADFEITVQELPEGRTRVTVKTTGSEVIDGHEPGIHIDRANHYRRVPSVRREEEEVLDAIQAKVE